jgi:phosphoribosylamine--glycine ligase
VTASGKNIEEAVKEAYGAVDQIRWEGMHYRKDIARRALEREKGRRGNEFIAAS